MLDIIYNLLNQGLQLFMSYIAVFIVIVIILITSWWVLFRKAGKKAWTSIIPFYNIYILFLITGLKPFLLILFFIPVVNFIAIPFLMIMINIRLAHSFGKNTAFGLGISLLPFIFYPLLAFSKTTMYLGANGVRKYDAPQPTSSDYSMPQNYKETKNVKVEKSPVISMGSGDTFNSAPVTSIPDITAINDDDNQESKEVPMINEQVLVEVNAPVLMPDSKQPERKSFLGTTNYSTVSTNNNSSTVSNQETQVNPQMSSFLISPKPPEKVTFIADAELPKQANEYKTCSNCGASMNNSVNTCFLCGNEIL